MNRKFLYIITGVIVIGGAAYIGLKPDEQISATGAPLADVSVPQLTPAQSAGEVAFNENCAACHGQNAVGQDGVAPPLVHPIYEPSHHGDQAFVMAAQRGTRQHHWPFGDMPPVEGITDTEIQSIIVYVRALQRENGIN
ncbi:cytochrome c [Ahrensia kielensis]|uniref:Cytochrome c n=1 Tax=Ahrensia kielensis TaxID=76980 RepID=A0ABU9T5D5_9HYPH